MALRYEYRVVQISDVGVPFVHGNHTDDPAIADSRARDLRRTSRDPIKVQRRPVGE
jgi:hypothetical protein